MDVATERLWPELPFSAWEPTYETLHRYSQIVGKIRTARTAPVNHWWHSTFAISPVGFTTGIIPAGSKDFDVEFDLLSHRVLFRTSLNETRAIALEPRSVADFYGQVLEVLSSLDISVHISDTPQEIANPIPFSQDREHASYDPEYAGRLARILMSANRVFSEFRGRFNGKSSPVHFFWGSFDLAVTRFSGRRAPPREGADSVTREAYSMEEISAGFWPGDAYLGGPAFYAYAAPPPAGFSEAHVRPAKAGWSDHYGEFILKYDDVRAAADPAADVMAFLQSTYAAGADLGRWPRADLERGPETVSEE